MLVARKSAPSEMMILNVSFEILSIKLYTFGTFLYSWQILCCSKIRQIVGVSHENGQLFYYTFQSVRIHLQHLHYENLIFCSIFRAEMCPRTFTTSATKMSGPVGGVERLWSFSVQWKTIMPHSRKEKIRAKKMNDMNIFLNVCNQEYGTQEDKNRH